MKQGTFEKEIFIQSDKQTVINVIADYGFKTTNRADIITAIGDTVHTKAYLSLNTSITNITRTTPKDNGVVLHEIIILSTPSIFFEYVFKQAGTAHEEMLECIKSFVENQN